MNKTYLEWLLSFVKYKLEEGGKYDKLMLGLHNLAFFYFYPTDENRVFDAYKLRELYNKNFLDETADISCSVLEVFIALAKRCEDDIMVDPNIGDRTYKWFWIMIQNLGLLEMEDDNFDEERFEDIMMRFMYREYDSDGRGSIFYTTRDRDFRTADLWYQMCWYLEEQFNS